MEKIESANQETLRRMLAGDPVRVDVIPASEAGNFTRTMSQIIVGENPEWTIPAMDYMGVS